MQGVRCLTILKHVSYLVLVPVWAQQNDFFDHKPRLVRVTEFMACGQYFRFKVARNL
jgi:hypothetical protein